MSRIKKYLDNKGLITLVKQIFGLHVELTWAEYTALVAANKDKPYVEYFITDKGGDKYSGAQDGSIYADMNDITVEGVFYFRAHQIINAPADAYEAEGKLDATLEVVRLSETPEAYIQTLRVAKSGKMFIYTRRIYNGNWSDWEELAKTNRLKWHAVPNIPPSKTWKEATVILQNYFPEITDWTSTNREFIFKTPFRMTTANNVTFEVVGFSIRLETGDTDSGFVYMYDDHLDYNWYGDDDAISSWFKDCPGIAGRIAYCPNGIANYIS